MKRFVFICTAILFVGAPLMPQMLSETTYFTSFAANFVFQNNLHEVVPGRLYRSAAMDEDDLERIIREKRIKSVIDLRLSSAAVEPSGLTEKTVVEATGARYVSIPFSSACAKQKDRIQQLLDVYEKVETPVLIHCTSGTHRTGIAAALWLLEMEGADLSRAQEQISLHYGFIDAERRLKSYIQGEPTLDTVLTRYAADQQTEKSTFGAWLGKQQDLEPHVTK